MAQLQPSDAGQEMLSTGRRAVVGVLAGSAWLAWGLTVAHALSRALVAALAVVASLLLAGCGYCIVQGWKSVRGRQASQRRLNRGFLLVMVLEAAGVACVIAAAQALRRVDLLADWVGMIIGVHFFALAKVFQAPVYLATGTAILLWCVLSWAFLSGDLISISVGLGVGMILWVTSCFNLLRVLTTRGEE